MIQLKAKPLALIFTFIIIGYLVVFHILGNKLFFRLDLTENKTYSISQLTKERLSSLEDDVSIELYFSNNLPPQAEQVRLYVKDIIAEFKSEAGKNLTVIWKDPVQDQDAMNEAHTLGIRAETVETIEKDKVGVTAVYLGIALRKHDKKEVISAVRNIATLEYDLLHRINKLMDMTDRVGFLKTDTTPPYPPMVVAQLGDELPPDPTQTKYRLMYDVLKQEYDLTYIDIRQTGGIDPSIKTVVVAGDNPAFFNSPKVIYILDQFVMRGGNLILFTPQLYLDQSKDGTPQAQQSSALLFDMLTSYGISVDTSFILDKYAGSMSFQGAAGIDRKMYPLILDVRGDRISNKNQATRNLSRVIVPWANPITVSAPKGIALVVDTLLKSSDTSFAKPLPLQVGVDQGWQLLFGMAAQKNQFKSHIIAAHITGQFESYFLDKERPAGALIWTERTDKGSIVVVSSSAMLSDELPPLTIRENSQYNIPFLVNLVDYLTVNNNLIDLRNKTLIDRSIWQENLLEDVERTTQIYRILNLIIMPLLLISFGFLLYFRRKRIQNSAL